MSGILRLIAGGLLAMICCYFGLLIKRKYKVRVATYRAAADYARTLKSELTTKKTPIPDIAAEFCKGRSGEFESALQECVNRQKNGSANLDGVSIKCLKPAENKELVGCLGGFGGSTLQEQIALAERLEKLAADRSEQCAKECDKLGNMYFKLSVLLGLAIIVALA